MAKTRIQRTQQKAGRPIYTEYRCPDCGGFLHSTGHKNGANEPIVLWRKCESCQKAGA